MSLPEMPVGAAGDLLQPVSAFSTPAIILRCAKCCLCCADAVIVSCCNTSGQEEIEATCFSLAERLDHMRSGGQNVPELMILPIYSQLPSDLQVGQEHMCRMMEGGGGLPICSQLPSNPQLHEST
jgi:hypothetical protein